MADLNDRVYTCNTTTPAAPTAAMPTATNSSLSDSIPSLLPQESAPGTPLARDSFVTSHLLASPHRCYPTQLQLPPDRFRC